MTLRETTDIIKEFCANEPNVGFVGVGNVYDLNSNQDVAYPSMVITQQTHSLIIDEEWYRFHFIIFYIDRLTEDKTNENQIQSTAITVLKNLVYNLEGMGVFASFDYTFNTFTERFESLCSGAYVDTQLNVPIADCDWETVFDYIKELFQKEIDGKQDKLISGVNIKSINGETILGSGNIEIQGGEECYTREEIDEKLEVITENVDINAQSILRNADNIIDLQSNKANKEDLDEVRILADRGSNAYNIINSNHLAHIALQDSEEYGEELYLNDKNYSDKWNQAATDAAKALERTDDIATVLDKKADKSEIPSLDGYATEQWVNDQGYLTEHQDLSDYYTKQEIDEMIGNIDTVLSIL